MQVTECDNCRKRGGAVPPPGWLALAELGMPSPSYLALLGSQSPGTELAGLFCGYRRVAEYSAAKALIAEAEGSGT